MTSKRDFTIFFPLLYCIVSGNMFLSPWVTEHLIYIYQDWRIINWTMTGALLLVAFIVYVTTHDFRFMKPLPLHQYRLFRLHPVVGMDAGIHFLLQLRRALQLARLEDDADGCIAFHHNGIFLHPANVPHPTPLHRTSSMEV